MKFIFNLLYSTKATLWLLLVFAIAMAGATFIEESHDTATAYKLVYGAKWFELVMVLLAINFIGNIKRYNLLSKKKYAGLLFHSAFIVMIIGAGVSRYIGYEGVVHIREGESSNVLLSPKRVVKVLAIDQGNEIRLNIPFAIRDTADANFSESISTKENGDLEISYKDFYKSATYGFAENVEGGQDYCKLNVFDNGNESDLFLVSKEISSAFSHKMAFNTADDTTAIIFFEKEGKYFLLAPYELRSITIPDMQEGVLPAGALVELNPMTQYGLADNSFKFIFHAGYKKAVRKVIRAEAGDGGVPALLLAVNFKDKDYEVPVFMNQEGFSDMQKANVEGISLLVGCGENDIRLPFSLRLNDFILERYPGSSNPSSYASEVTIMDTRKEGTENFRIYMNHVLDYDGYRFFQSSYDKDEKGTVLSVNHDFWGTWITYFGYTLLALGFILTLFNKHSRFQILAKSIREIRKMRVGSTLLLMLALGITAQAQEIVRKPVSPEHAERLGMLIAQTFDGRSEPVHTMAYDALHKISRKDQFEFAGKGKMDAMQMFVDLILDRPFWKNQKLIYVREKAVADMLGITGKYAAYADLVDASGNFKLKELTEEAFRKKGQDQNLVDKEIIKVSERFEIFMMLSDGSMLKVFPEPVANSTVWINWNDPKAQILLQDKWNILADLNIPQLNYNNFMGAYLNAAYTGINSEDFSRADRIVGYIENIQRQSAVADLIPSANQVKMEIYYNKAQIFILLRNIYGALAIVLLILAYLDNLLVKKNKIVSLSLNFFLVLLGLAFAYHTFGMGLRWYLSGHAPWSNGYEALLLVGWAGILAGFSFIRFSKIPLAATALLAFFTLMTASHSSYDPQLTNLQPVLKSYWLVIHVATLTISYGFLGLAFILGIFILSLYLIRNKHNGNRYSLMIKELSHINEMNITIGLVLATVGTFLGGIWANESWGRYWGWDAKETWALIITMIYSIVVHLRLVDKLRGDYLFTVGSVLAFGTVLMTFIGVNYYLSKGMHSYGTGDTPIFPIWAWIAILSVFALVIAAGIKDKAYRKHQEKLHSSETN
ncbi:MAG: hypothetical protein CFE21_14710 [Bacteroidetes bacterium B1(2017)]|nr:MAG: hypothetical protein CFE21_14710 [Bacteroidetes bacterium B1(2017)]